MPVVLPARSRPRPPWLVAVAVLLTALALAVLSALPRANSAFVARTTNRPDTLGAVDYFTCATAIAADAPAVWYRLDDTRSTAVNSAQSGDDGSYQGTTTKSQAPACERDSGSAVAFNGSSGYISLATRYTVPTTYTFEAWFKTTSTSGGLIGGIGASATGSSTTVDRIVYMTNNGRLTFGTNTTNKTTVTSGTRYNDGDWHHLVATLGSNGMNLYVDDVRAATSSTTATGTYVGYFRVAYDNLSAWPNAPSSNYFRGTLDDVAAYTTTLSAADVDSHYQAGT